MGIQERKEREKEQRRLEILNAAERMFFSKGIKNSTMDDVAETAELSKGTLYLYFKSKEELYLAITLRALEILRNKFQEAFSRPGNGLEKVFSLGMAFFQFSKDYSDYYNAISYYEFNEMNFENGESVAGNCSDAGQEVLGFVIDAIRTGIADGSIRSDIDPVSTAVILWGQASGVIQQVALKGTHMASIHHIDMKDIVQKSFELIQCALENRHNFSSANP